MAPPCLRQRRLQENKALLLPSQTIRMDELYNDVKRKTRKPCLLFRGIDKQKASSNALSFSLFLASPL